MKNEVTLHGRIGDVPKLHATGTGGSAVRFSLAVDDSFYDSRTSQWRKAPTVRFEVVVFGGLADNVYDSLMASENSGKGLLVNVTGAFSDNTYTRESRYPDGEDITIRRIQLKATDVAPSLRYATAVVTRKARDTHERPAAPKTTKPAAKAPAAPDLLWAWTARPDGRSRPRARRSQPGGNGPGRIPSLQNGGLPCPSTASTSGTSSAPTECPMAS
jgi:single-strand DNA-binding protein